MTAHTNEKSLDRFCDSIISSTAAVLSQISGREWTVESSGETADEFSDIQVQFSFDGALRGTLAFCVTTEVAIRLAKLLMCEPMPEASAELSADDREALDELLRQIAGHAASRLEPAFGKSEMKFIGTDHLDKTSPRVSVVARDAEHSLPIMLCVSDDLRNSISASAPSLSSQAEVQKVDPIPTADPPHSAATSRLEQHALRESNLELLLDVPLAVTLRFGQREVMLKEILELSPGSVLELDRQINEPVDLLLGKRVIARGDVVIVDGNYGLQVTEVASPAEKIACLP